MKQQIGLVYLGDDRKIAAQIDRLVNEIPFIKFSTVSNLGKVNEGFAPTDRVVVLVDREAASEFPQNRPAIVVGNGFAVAETVALMKRGYLNVLEVAQIHPSSFSSILESAISEWMQLKQKRESNVILNQTLHLARTVLDSISSGVGILDRNGTILSTNLAWRKNNSAAALFGESCGKGDNYLEFLSRSENESGKRIEQNVRDVLQHERDDISHEYPAEENWYRAVALGVEDVKVAEAIVIHDDVTGERNLKKRSASKKMAEDRVANLTRRELQVMRLVVSGRPNKAIAKELDISIKTVEMHRSNMMKKLGVVSIPDLVRIAIMFDESLSQPVGQPSSKETAEAKDKAASETTLGSFI